MGILKPFKGIYPKIGEHVYISENSVIIGDVIIGEGSSIWFNVVIRGDINYIRIGKRVNIQDGAILHVTENTYPLNIEDGVSIAHGALIHGCTLEEGCLIGIGANILDGARIGKGALIAAGSVVREGTEIPPGVLAAGVPAIVKRELNEQEKEMIKEIESHYVAIGKEYNFL